MKENFTKPFIGKEFEEKFKHFSDDELRQILRLCEFALLTGEDAVDKQSNLVVVGGGSRYTTTDLKNQVENEFFRRKQLDKGKGNLL